MSKLWTRRQALVFSSKALLTPILLPLSIKTWAHACTVKKAALTLDEPVTKVLPDAASLYRNAFVLDSNTLASIGFLQYEEDVTKKLQSIRDSGLTAIKSTLGGGNGTFEDTVADLAAAQALMDKHPELFLKVAKHSDLRQAKAMNRVAVIFSFEAASMLEDKLERIEMFRQLDVLVMQLTYNHKTPFGSGCLDGETGGITDLGRKAIQKMNEVGVALDLSHANAQTTSDGITISAKPVVITHAGCRAVYDHPRNKTDRELKALADKGGVIGIYMLPFLTVDTRQPMLADYIQHMVHALNVCGEDHVGIGTDSLFFKTTQQDLDEIAKQEADRKQAGVGAPGENRPPYIPDINTPRKLEFVTDALLKHGYSDRVTEKVLGRNFSRVYKEIWLA